MGYINTSLYYLSRVYVYFVSLDSGWVSSFPWLREGLSLIDAGKSYQEDELLGRFQQKTSELYISLELFVH